ncbi:MAG: ABC transporter ATP-binding protein [Candidatus Saganbacteria bacterium]|nr:ABC transporter ATP-binding protein [Candidatus Saganbacteria bacterium]
MYAIQTKNLTKKFKNTIAVNNLDLNVPSGVIFGLIGPDGGGKTTTIRLLCGLYKIDGGSASLLGIDVAKESEKVKDSIGYMSQKFSLYGDLSVEENLDFFADIHLVPRQEVEKRKKELLEFSRLEKFKDRPAQKLSGGMKQKLALACTLIHTPKVLFLDEPTTGVDPISRREFWQIIKLLVPAVTVFVTTPYMDEAEMCDRVALIHSGKILTEGTPDEIKKKMEKQIIELLCDQIRPAARHLENKYSFEVFGDRLHIVSDNAAGDIPRIEALLKERSIDVCEIRQIEPSLEDVFVWMMK